ncbi:MAG TPA: saccharopine dehydrogenase NADP-binding domain-containing protein [Candidatus Baltobacteraceae bacterium]|nr:saccharopine dehydrogenase NADP-binding domain-containing protein [Candidatus Baltobacteraceae bacterium]
MKVAVYGASGHTGRFVVGELLRRGHTPVAIGRDESKAAAAVAAHGSALETRIASLDSADSLDRALSGAAAVIHCAGPFLDTAQPLVEAALRSRVQYFDVTAEQGSAASTFELFDAPARERGIAIVPAAGFYGGLGDLLATYAMGDWTRADRIDLAIALNSWRPTLGTRRTGQRNTLPRLTLSDGTLKTMQPSAPTSWNFSEPFGTQDVTELPFTETILIARHLRVSEMRNYMNQAPLRDLRDPATPEPIAADAYGRSNQRFAMDVLVRNGDEERRVTLQGGDIYAITAPIVVSAVERICQRQHRPAGAFALGQLLDASEFLQSLEGAGEIVTRRPLKRSFKV